MASGQIVGFADARIRHRYGGRLDYDLVHAIRNSPQTLHAAGRFETGISLQLDRTQRRTTVIAEGVEPLVQQRIYPARLAVGRMLLMDDECVIDQKLAERLGGVELGDALRVIRFGEPVVLTVVGILDRPLLEVLQ